MSRMKRYPFTTAMLVVVAIITVLALLARSGGAQDDFYPPIRRHYYRQDGVVCYEAATVRYYDRNPALALSCVKITEPAK